MCTTMPSLDKWFLKIIFYAEIFQLGKGNLASVQLKSGIGDIQANSSIRTATTMTSMSANFAF